MLSKVSRHARRGSAQESSTGPKERAQMVDRPPDLVRWCDFSDPFPPVARGGYVRYYAAAEPRAAEAPAYCPLLSQYSDKLSARDVPRQAPLFVSSQPPPRPLVTIHEASMESISLTPKRPTSLAVSTNGPSSLRRQHRRLLRTPSIERDFAVYGRHFLSSTASIAGAVEAPGISLAHSHSPSAHSSSSGSSDSTHSESTHTDSAHSAYPITPSTSVGSEDELGDGHYVRVLLKDDWELLRPDSRASFSTARSGFSNAC